MAIGGIPPFMFRPAEYDVFSSDAVRRYSKSRCPRMPRIMTHARVHMILAASRNANFCTFPVDVLGIVPNTKYFGIL